MKIFMMDTIPKLVPMWHDLAAQHFVRLNKITARQYSNLKLADHGGIGVDVNNDGDVLVAEVAKYPKTQINFAAKNCALPFLPLKKVLNTADPCMDSLKKEDMDFFKFRLKLRYVRVGSRRKTSDLETLRQELRNIRNTGNYGNTSIDVPKSVIGLARHLPKRAFVPTFNVAYAGGNLAASKYSTMQSILHPSTEGTGKLCITPIQSLSDGQFEPILSEQISVCLRNEPILQIESALNELCCIRQKDSFHLLNMDTLKLTSKTINEIQLYHIATCPYNPVEILSVYKNGILKLRNMETRKTIWSVEDYSCHDPTLIYPTWRCGFGSHPFSAMCMNERYLSSFDLRTKNDMKKLFSVQNSSCYVSEELVALRQWNRNPFQHFLASSHHLMLCDERYPKRPILYFNHILHDYPVYCEVANLANSTNSVIVIGTQESRELSAFFIDSPQTQIQAVSLGPLLTLSSPSDCIDSLKLHCYSVNETLSSRLAYPLTGVCIIPSQNKTFTVFQLTSMNDMFHQTFKETYSNILEKTYRVGAGCILTPPEKILPHLKNWISTSDPAEVSEPVNESFSRLLINVAKILDFPKEISASCCLCRMSNASAEKKLVLSEVCPTCNLDSAESQHFSKAMTASTAIVGPASEESNFLECNKNYLSTFTDEYSRRILGVWLEPGDERVNESTEPLTTMETNLDLIAKYQSLSLNIPSQEDISFIQDENISINTNLPLTMETSEYDFAEDTQEYSEMVPPSQEVRPLIGESLLEPVKSKLNRSTISISSTAGF